MPAATLSDERLSAVGSIAYEPSRVERPSVSVKAATARLPWWSFWAVLGLAIALRAIGLFTWSLWEDEETTIYFALNSGKAFPSAFPLFFFLLKTVFQATGVSDQAGRLFALVLGTFSLGLTFACVRRHINDRVALIAMLLMTMSLGHVFWSQSCRYYVAVLCCQLLSVGWFLEGFERDRKWPLLASNLAFVAGLYCHFSAVLLAPVFWAYLGWTLVSRARGAGYSARNYLLFGVPHLLVLVLFAARLRAMQGMLGTWVVPSARDPLHILVTAVFYFGVPLVLLAVSALMLRRPVGRVMTFFALLAVVPMAELLVIAALNIVNVTWYYGFISLVGTGVLAASTWMALRERHRRFGWAVAAATLCYYSLGLFAYYTTMHGDRPRWKEATQSLATLQRQNVAWAEMPVFANVPGVVARYLDVPRDQTMGNTRVQPMAAASAGPNGAFRDGWYVLEARVVSSDMRDWLGRCQATGSFEAHTGPRDRTIAVYRCLNVQSLEVAAASRAYGSSGVGRHFGLRTSDFRRRERGPGMQAGERAVKR